VGGPWHGRGSDDGRTGGRWPVDCPATDRRLIRKYIGQTGDHRLGGKRERVVAVLHGMHHLEYELGLPEHLQVVNAFFQDLRHRLLSPGLVQLICQFFLKNEYRHLLRSKLCVHRIIIKQSSFLSG